jgi:Alr-MurF fusion protein
MYNLKQIAEITNSVFEGKENFPVSHFAYDSRNVINTSDVIFIAFKTGKNDGHIFIPDLIEKGVKSFWVFLDFDTSAFKNQQISFIKSKDTLTSLQKLASYHRKQFNIPVIGITGSNGKTVVKEWLYQILKDHYQICRSPKSFNSQLGVPLSVLNLNTTHTLAIFEAGISMPGEMDILEKIIQPTIGVVTSIGSAHDEGFSTREQKIAEKLKLVLNADHIILNNIPFDCIPDSIREKTILIGKVDTDVLMSLSENVLTLSNLSGESETYSIPFSDQISALNIATSICVSKQFYKNELITERIKSLQPIALRLEIKNGIQNSLLINDYYNSDLDSLRLALNFMNAQSRRKHKAVIVSDIEQSGFPDNQLYQEVASLISANKIDLLVGIGKNISTFKNYFTIDSLFFENTEEFVKHFAINSNRFSNSMVLLKGARSFGFESIAALFQQKSHDTVFEVNLNKLIDNVNYYRSLLQPNVKLMCVVKAMGYGGGGSELARTLQHIGVNYLAVAYADEGVELRNSHITLPVMVMSPEADAMEDIITYQLEPEIYSFKSLKDFAEKTDRLGISQPYPIHIKIDTGMHRLGFEIEDIDRLIVELKAYSQLRIQSIFSHLVASDDPLLDDFSRTQIKLFESVIIRFREEFNYPFLTHMCNSGGISRFPNAHYNMVRLGIGMHGIGVNEKEQRMLHNVSSLKTKISQIKSVKAGDTIGYSRKGLAVSEMRIATIPIGYADGFSRALGNGKSGIYINNVFCKTVGNICMDMCMIDVTHVQCAEGDDVVVFETYEQIKSIADAMNTITYEVLTSISGRVKRVYVQE